MHLIRIICMEQINKNQAKASSGTGGVSLVIAGAGTGKTTTMIRKIINCIDAGIVTPERILIMTFSRKAAEEIRERISRNSSSTGEIGFAGTYHSFSLKLLKEYSSGYLIMKEQPSFPSVIREEDKEKAMRNIVMRDPGRFSGVPYDAVLSIAENLERLPDYMMKKLRNSPLYNELLNVKDEYRRYKASGNLIDYEDMIDDAALLLETNPVIRSDVNSRFTYIFVDEFQDTSENNLRLLNALVPETGRNLFMVGDDFQSIYAFRAARVEYLINIKKYFPETEIHKLTMNYRSRKEIVKLSNRFIRLNRFRTDKSIKSFRGKGGRVIFHQAENAISEAGIISRIICRDSSTKNTGILYRNNSQGEIIRKHSGQNLNDSVNLMTMHASKGLEFERVIIAGISDRIIPDRASNIEEERRLFYVAMTRAKDEMHLIYYKNSNGRLPRFIWELGFRED